MNARALLAMALAYAVPGAGHFLLGRRRRAIAFCAIVVFMFAVGVAIDGGVYELGAARGQLLPLLASLASMGSGALYFVAKAIASAGDIRSMTFEYGRTFTLTAGLMNLLLVLDCYDMAMGRKP
jgi:hypothetical protein